MILWPVPSMKVFEAHCFTAGISKCLAEYATYYHKLCKMLYPICQRKYQCLTNLKPGYFGLPSLPGNCVRFLGILLGIRIKGHFQ